MREKEFTEYHKKYIGVIRAIARKLGQRNDALVEDLQQEGLMALWLLSPKRATRNQDAWIRQAMRNRMIDYLRKINPQNYESLDARLESGDQIEQATNGKFVLISRRVALPNLMDESELPGED